jgi:hypothetical protein
MDGAQRQVDSERVASRVILMPPSSTARTITTFLSGAINIIQLKTDVKGKQREITCGKDEN